MFKAPYRVTVCPHEYSDTGYDQDVYDFSPSFDGETFTIVFSEEEVTKYENTDEWVFFPLADDSMRDKHSATYLTQSRHTKKTIQPDSHSGVVNYISEDEIDMVRKWNALEGVRRIKELETKSERYCNESTSLNVGKNEHTAGFADCTACKAEESHVDEWTNDLECAVRLACSLTQAKERGSTAFHEAEWKTLRGKTRKRAFEAFRRALPDHLKEADPKKK